MVVEYDGTGYCGFQFQPGLPTIQGELEKAIGKLTGERRRVFGASRTDTGVHAWGQVASFNTGSVLDTETIVQAMNHYLPEDISVKEAHKVPLSFNVRRKATSREYEYRILNSRTRSPLRNWRLYHVWRSLDFKAMSAACGLLAGKHDFASFVTDYEKGETVRTVLEATLHKGDDTLVFRILADSFLPHQVRNTVGTLVQIGLGKLAPGHISRLIQSRKPGMAGPTAPAHGLYLNRINYPQPFGAT
ncbi:MAG: tRNA pseudouridine(38-40) synthase TruA [Chloroflexi bacterium]|nr:tRNA pseudouridine(38-40) synthase TruA [Chloroflexota bacterium]